MIFIRVNFLPKFEKILRIENYIKFSKESRKELDTKIASKDVPSVNTNIYRFILKS